MHGVVLAVDRKNGLILSTSLCGDQFTRDYERFFVSDAEGLSRLDCLIGGFESGYTNNRTDHEVNIWMRGNANCARRTMNDFCFAGSVRFQARLQRVRILLGSH